MLMYVFLTYAFYTCIDVATIKSTLWRFRIHYRIVSYRIVPTAHFARAVPVVVEFEFGLPRCVTSCGSEVAAPDLTGYVWM